MIHTKYRNESYSNCELRILIKDLSYKYAVNCKSTTSIISGKVNFPERKSRWSDLKCQKQRYSIFLHKMHNLYIAKADDLHVRLISTPTPMSL